MNQIAIALSVALSFLCSEFLGLLSGGMISAGYLALHIGSPIRIVSTVICSLAVYGTVLLIQKFVIIYGRRRFMASVLLGFLFAGIWEIIIPYSGIPFDTRIIGYIIPGLIANDMLKQGPVKTVASLSFLTLLTYLLSLLVMVVFR